MWVGIPVLVMGREVPSLFLDRRSGNVTLHPLGSTIYISVRGMRVGGRVFVRRLGEGCVSANVGTYLMESVLDSLYRIIM